MQLNKIISFASNNGIGYQMAVIYAPKSGVLSISYIRLNR